VIVRDRERRVLGSLNSSTPVTRLALTPRSLAHRADLHHTTHHPSHARARSHAHSLGARITRGAIIIGITLVIALIITARRDGGLARAAAPPRHAPSEHGMHGGCADASVPG